MSARRHYSQKVAGILHRGNGQPRLTLITDLVRLIEDACIAAAGRGAAMAVEDTLDRGRLSALCARIRDEERLRWSMELPRASR